MNQGHSLIIGLSAMQIAVALWFIEHDLSNIAKCLAILAGQL